MHVDIKTENNKIFASFVLDITKLNAKERADLHRYILGAYNTISAPKPIILPVVQGKKKVYDPY